MATKNVAAQCITLKATVQTQLWSSPCLPRHWADDPNNMMQRNARFDEQRARAIDTWPYVLP